MVGDIAKSALDVLKLSPRYLSAVVLASGALLFAPRASLDALGVSAFAASNRQWLGLALLASSAICCVAAGVSTWNAVLSSRRHRAARKRLLKRLESLTEDEKQILRYYYAEGTRANTLRVDDGVVQGLVEVGIIYRSASMGSVLGGFAHNISDLAWEYIQSNPMALLGTTNTYRTDKRPGLW